MNIVLTNKSVNIAGGENYVLYLASELQRRGYNIIIAPLKDSELAVKSKKLGFETLEIKYSAIGAREIVLAFDLANKLRNKNVDIIHTNSNTDRTIGALTSKLLKCKNVAQIHSHFSVKERLHHNFRNRLIDHFITDSFSSMNQLLSTDKIKDQRVSAIHIGIPDAQISSVQRYRKSAREELNIRNSEILISAIGRMVPFKGHVYLLRAFRVILGKQKNIKLMLVGNGEIKNDLLQECNKLNILERVIFTGYRTDTDRLLAATDIFVHPSLDNGGESFPIAVLLALRAGLPVVATDVSDIQFQVVNGSNGYIVNPADVEMLAKRIAFLANNPDLRIEFGNNSFKLFKGNFTLDKMTDKIENLYFSILHESAKEIIKNNQKPNSNILMRNNVF